MKNRPRYRIQCPSIQRLVEVAAVGARGKCGKAKDSASWLFQDPVETASVAVSMGSAVSTALPFQDLYPLQTRNSLFLKLPRNLESFGKSGQSMQVTQAPNGTEECVFQGKSSTDSDSSRPVIPIESVHRFRREAD